MLNDTDIVKNTFDPRIPAMHYETVSECGAFGCRRTVGAGFYDPESRRTILCWHEGGMDIVTKEYDHKSKQWSEKRKVFRNGMTGKWDYHNYPVMILAPDGKALIFYCIHSNKMYQLTPDKCHSADTVYKRKVICEDQTAYPHPVVYKDAIYIFYSRNQEISYPYRPLCYIKSTDCGETWSDPVTVIDTAKRDPYKFDEVYQCGGKFVPAQGIYPDRILLSWTMWGGPKGHASQGMGAYFAYLSMEDEKMYSADGKCLGKTVAYSDMEEHCTVERIMPSEQQSHTISAVICESMPGGEHAVIFGRRDPVLMTDEVCCAVRRDGRWQTTVVENRTDTVKDAVYDARKDELRIACVLSHKLVIYACKNGIWQMESVSDIPYSNGANCVPYINFINGFDNKYQILLSTIDNRHMTEDYSGKWSVVVYGE